jgi:hypothetical protein
MGSCKQQKLPDAVNPGIRLKVAWQAKMNLIHILKLITSASIKASSS